MHSSFGGAGEKSGENERGREAGRRARDERRGHAAGARSELRGGEGEKSLGLGLARDAPSQARPGNALDAASSREMSHRRYGKPVRLPFSSPLLPLLFAFSKL